MVKKISLLLVIVLSLAVGTAFAVPYYDAGSQRFVITAGVSFPLTVTNFNTNETGV